MNEIKMFIDGKPVGNSILEDVTIKCDEINAEIYSYLTNKEVSLSIDNAHIGSEFKSILEEHRLKARLSKLCHHKSMRGE